MQIVILIMIILVALFVLWFCLKSRAFVKFLVKKFKSGNVLTCGAKGHGKDLVHQKIIEKRKKENYYANIDYGYKFNKITPKDISVSPNTFTNFITGDIIQVPRILCEKTDIYLSDGGVIFPSQYDTILHKTYKSFPIYYALSRQLDNINIHVNTQQNTRLWKAIREQADSFVYVRKTINIPFFLLTKCVWYEKFESCEKRLRNIKKRFRNKYSKAEYDLYNASNGEIKEGWIISIKKKIKYDTRAFEKVVYGDQPRITTITNNVETQKEI